MIAALATHLGQRGIDVVLAVNLRDALANRYPGGYELRELDADDFMLGGLFNREEAAELVLLSSLDGVRTLDDLGHLLLYGC